MTYRTARKGCEELKVGKYKELGQYNPSTTELLLEQLCETFGTELLQAYVNPVNGTKLVRESKPAIVEHPNRRKRILQVQHTRFSPLYSSRVIEVYNKNRRIEGKKRFLMNHFGKKLENSMKDGMPLKKLQIPNT